MLDRPEMAGRRILLVGDNFGAGSSREHAPWALTAWGIRAILSTSLRRHLPQQRLKNGLLPIVVDAGDAPPAVRAGRDEPGRRADGRPRRAGRPPARRRGPAVRRRPVRQDDAARRHRRARLPARRRTAEIDGLGGGPPGPRSTRSRAADRFPATPAGTEPSAGARRLGGHDHPRRRRASCSSAALVAALALAVSACSSAAAPTSPAAVAAGVRGTVRLTGRFGRRIRTAASPARVTRAAVAATEARPSSIPQPGTLDPHPCRWSGSSPRSTAATSPSSSPGRAASSRATSSTRSVVSRDGNDIALTVVEGAVAAGRDLHRDRRAQGDDRRPRRARAGPVHDRCHERAASRRSRSRSADRARRRPGPGRDPPLGAASSILGA